jgi:polysaccharide biosynthesis/export protein
MMFAFSTGLRKASLALLTSLLISHGGWAQTPTNTKATKPDAYTLGTGDEVKVIVYGQPELAAEGQISARGTLVVPLLGSVYVAGKTTADAAEFIAERYQHGNFLKDAQINLLVTQYRSQVVAILGKVSRPGRLVLEGPTSLTQALAWAGGVAPNGSERLILTRITQSRQERIEYDLQQLLNYEAGDIPPVWLRDGDTIYVNGEVNSPGMYPLDRPLNVMQALGAGGGPTARASNGSVKLVRQQANGKLQELRAKPEDPVMDGDVLVVKESLF